MKKKINIRRFSDWRRGKIFAGRVMAVILFCCLVGFPLRSESRVEVEPENELSMTLAIAVKIAMERNLELKNACIDKSISSLQLQKVEDDFSVRLSADSHQEVSISEAEDGAGTDRDVSRALDMNLSRRFKLTGGEVNAFSTLNFSDFDTDISGGEPAEKYHHTFGIRLRQPLLKDAWNTISSAPVVSAERNLENSDIDVFLARENLKVTIVRLYYQALKAQKLLEVIEAGVREAETHLQHTQIRLEEGLVAQIDVSQAELQLARQRNALISARRNVNDALDTLKQHLELPLNLHLVLHDELDISPEEIDAAAAVAEALANRKEIKRLENRLNNATLDVRVASNARLPDIALEVSADVERNGGSLSDVIHTERPDYAVEFGITYTFGDKTASIDYSRSTLSRRRILNELEITRRNITAEVKASIRKYEALKESILVSEKAVETAEVALNLANESYSEGIIGNIDLLKAQDELLNARSEYYSALLDLAVSKVEILRALGRTIDVERLSFHGADSPVREGGK